MAVGLHEYSWGWVTENVRLSIVVLLMIYFTYPANLLVYGVNDIFDYETDKLNAKKT
jgi:4-hydroxybenzoate polyprenyltransferase